MTDKKEKKCLPEGVLCLTWLQLLSAKDKYPRRLSAPCITVTLTKNHPLVAFPADRSGCYPNAVVTGESGLHTSLPPRDQLYLCLVNSATGVHMVAMHVLLPTSTRAAPENSLFSFRSSLCI